MTSNSGQELRDLLAQVAAGTLAPDEASQRLTASPDAPTGDRAAAPPSEGPIQRVVVNAAALKLVVVGDPNVVGASVEGPHIARRRGDTLVIDTDGTPAEGDFSYESGPRLFGAFGLFNGGQTLVVRVHPALPLELTVQAGSAAVTHLVGGLTFTVEAGSLTASDCSGPIDGRVGAGSAKLDWRLDRGHSALKVELGSIKLRLDPRSDVTVQGKVEMGSLDLGRGAKSAKQLVVGAGKASLDLSIELGSAKVQVA